MHVFPPIAAAFLTISVELLGAERVSRADDDVLIYYANETCLNKQASQEWDTVVNWLDSSRDCQAATVAARLRKDRVVFPQAVKADIKALQSNFSTSRNAPVVFVFTNCDFRLGRYRELASNGSWIFHPLPCGDRFGQTHYRAPLANAEVFFACLSEIAGKLEMRDRSCVLITKSHGTDSLALTARLTVNPNLTSRRELLQRINRTCPSVNESVADQSIGISKETYFTTLEKLGQTKGMHFAAVLMESCHSGPPTRAARWKLPSNVSALFATMTNAANYTNVNYQSIVERRSAGEYWAEAIAGSLPNRFFRIQRNRSRYVSSTSILILIFGGRCWLRRPRSACRRASLPCEWHLKSAASIAAVQALVHATESASACSSTVAVACSCISGG